MVSNESPPNAPSTIGFRTSFVRSMLALGAVAGPIVALYHWHSSVVEGCINLAYAVVCIALLAYLQHSRNVERVGTIALLLSYLNFTLGYLIASFDETRAAVFFPLLAAALFLKGEKAGLAWLGLIISTIVLLPEIHRLPTGYPTFDAIPVSISLLGMFLIVLYYERARESGAQSAIDAAVLRAGEERMRALYAHQFGFVLVISKSGIVQSASDSVVRVLGYAPSELVGTDVLAILHPDDFVRVSHAVSALTRASGSGPAVEMRLRRRNGEYCTVEGHGVNLLEDPLIRGVVLNAHDISERKKMEEGLRDLAWTDVLTGLRNRRRFFELSEQEMLRSKRYGRPLAALMVDIDYFKAVNDTYGHSVGDMVLQKLGEVVTKVARGIDIIGRVGGEEFALVLPETETHQAVTVAERLRVALAGAAVEAAGAQPVHFTVSIGVTTLLNSDATFDTILKRADAALYAAKESGRNRVCTYEDLLPNKRVA